MAKKPAKPQSRGQSTKTQVKKMRECPRCSMAMQWAKIENKKMAFWCLECGCIEDR